VKPFFDTNILVYAFLEDEKRDQAQQVLASGGVISAQVLNEFTNVALRKFNRSWEETTAAIATIRRRFPEIIPLSEETHAAALALVRNTNISFYDALILAAAVLADCDVLFSEDLQDGQRIGPLAIRNPFTS
jgi:predicted nucleic acid-binding protein